MTEYWNRLPRDLVKSPSLEIVKSCLDKILSYLLYRALLEQRGWTKHPPLALSNITHWTILWISDFWTSEWSKSNTKLRGRSKDVFSLFHFYGEIHQATRQLLSLVWERREGKRRAKLCFLRQHQSVQVCDHGQDILFLSQETSFLMKRNVNSDLSSWCACNMARQTCSSFLCKQSTCRSRILQSRGELLMTGVNWLCRLCIS